MSLNSYTMIGLFEEKDNIGSVRDVSLANMTITGYLAHFGSVDDGNDIIEKGAFAKTLVENRERMRFLNQHDFKQPHNKFQEIKEDDKGLYFEVKMIPGVSYSMDVLKLYDAGVLSEQSIGFQTIRKSMESKAGVEIRRITEMKLAEGSNVTIAMNRNAKFAGFKSAEEATQALQRNSDKINNIVKFLRNGTATDDTFAQLEIGLKQLQAEAYEIGRASAPETKSAPSDDDTRNSNTPQIEIIKSFTQSLNIN